MVKSSAYPSLERKPGGPDNWVEQAGGLPKYIERIAKHLHYERGYSIQRAIAIAVNTVKRWARKGTVAKYGDPHHMHVTGITQAQAAAALAEWVAKRAKARALPGTPMYGRIGRRRSVKLAEELVTLKALADRANAIVDPHAKAEARALVFDLAVFTAGQRNQLAKRGAARPDGSFPIRNEQDLRNAIRAIGRAKNPAAAKRHIIQRAKALGLTSLLPDGWTTDLAAQINEWAAEDTIGILELARAMTKDGRPSFKKNGGKYRHGFVPVNQAAKVAKAKGSPIAMKRMNRLFGAGGDSDEVKLRGAGGKGTRAGRIGQVTGTKVADAPAKAIPGHNTTIRKKGTSAARKDWDAIDDSLKVIRNGQRYVVTQFRGKQQLVPWVGPKEKIEPGHNVIVRQVSKDTAKQMTPAQLRKLLKTKGKAQGNLARAPLNAALRGKIKAAKR